MKDFQDYLFFQVCQVAAELRLPLQVHTGTGQGKNTNALCLLEAIQKNPETQFVLLHCSYPWIQDASLPGKPLSKRPRRPEHAAAVFFAGGRDRCWKS